MVDGLGPIASLRVRDLPGDVALLDEAMTVLEPLAVNVEIKNDPDEPGSRRERLAQPRRRRGSSRSGATSTRVVVSSFDLATLDAVRAGVGRRSPSGGSLGAAGSRPRGRRRAAAHGFGALHPWS